VEAVSSKTDRRTRKKDSLYKNTYLLRYRPRDFIRNVLEICLYIYA
jgi:acyl carrier protein phosphodiesterase